MAFLLLRTRLLRLRCLLLPLALVLPLTELLFFILLLLWPLLDGGSLPY